MLQQLATIVIGILGGIGVGVQTPIVNALGQRIGTAAGSLVVHIGGAIFSVILLVLRGGENLRNLNTVPWWMCCAGIFGVFLFVTINHTVPRIGAAAAITLLTVGQLVAALIIDHFGLFEVVQRSVDGQRVVAAGFLLLGVYLMIR